MKSWFWKLSLSYNSKDFVTITSVRLIHFIKILLHFLLSLCYIYQDFVTFYQDLGAVQQLRNAFLRDFWLPLPLRNAF